MRRGGHFREKPKEKGPRVNTDIRVQELRVIDPDGEQLGILTLREALTAAEEKGLDLVEVAPAASPPVCRIMDYGKYKYEEKKKSQEAKKSQTNILIKEVKFRPKTDEHDFQTKMRHARRFLEDGAKVKATVLFRGREIAHADIGFDILQKVADETEDVAVLESHARREGRTMHVILSPKQGVGRPKEQGKSADKDAERKKKDA